MINVNATNLKTVTDEKLNVGNVESNLGVNNLYYTLDGKPFYMVSGEFQYGRYENTKWAEALSKIKAGGVNVIATYCFWNCHEKERGQYDFEGDFDLKKFVEECKKQDLLVILRLGPWCHAELKYGGFPEYIQKYKKKRTNDKKYLKAVEDLFAQYYNQVSDLMYPNGPVIGAQLENEYNGNFEHIKALKDIAVRVGFKVPMFTATAWPKKVDETEVIPMYGCYPEAPWTTNINPIPDDNRFACIPISVPREIGNDLIKLTDQVDYDKTPISYAELGVGNQVTNHRRPIISTQDAYANTFASIAKGGNLIGYYVYHGGRNPNFDAIQESKRTGYPNDLPVISYDFQAPLGEYGYAKEKYYYIRLLHYLCLYYDKNFAAKSQYFPLTTTGDESSYCVRMNKDLSGYCFMSTYRRKKEIDKEFTFDFEVETEKKNISLPKVTLKGNDCFVYPYNFKLGDVKIDYITAQPFLRYENEKGVHLLFFKHPNVDPILRVNNHRYLLRCENKVTYIVESDKKYLIELYDVNYASKIYFDGKKPVYSENCIYTQADGKLVEEVEEVLDNEVVALEETKVVKKPNDIYMYDAYKEKAYNLKVSQEALDKYDDIKIILKSNCDKAHFYEDKTIVGDYMLYDGVMEICTSRYKNYLKEDKALYIKTSAVKKKAKVYYEIPTVVGDSSVTIDKVIGVTRKDK